MTDFYPPDETPPPAPETLAPPPFPWEQPPPRRAARIWPLAVLIGLGLAGLFSLGVLIFGIQAFREVTAGRTEAKHELNQVLKLLSEHKENEAYNLFSSHARKTTSLADLMTENHGSGFQLVEGYQDIEITTFEIEKGDASRADAPHGKYAEVTGWITYGNQKPPNQFHATLELEGDDWLLYGINILTHPDVIS